MVRRRGFQALALLIGLTVAAATTYAAEGSRPPVETVRDLFRAATGRDGEKACSLVTKRGRSVIDAPTRSGRQACVESVEDFHDEEIDVHLLRVHTLRKDHKHAAVATLTREDGVEESFVLSLVHRERGWLISGAKERD